MYRYVDFYSEQFRKNIVDAVVGTALPISRDETRKLAITRGSFYLVLNGQSYLA